MLTADASNTPKFIGALVIFPYVNVEPFAFIQVDVAPPALREAFMLALALLVNVCPIPIAKTPPAFKVIVPLLVPPALRLNVAVEVELNVPPFSTVVIPVNVLIPVAPESIPEMEVVLLAVKVTAAVAKVMVAGTVNASTTVAFPVKVFITELPPRIKV